MMKEAETRMRPPVGAAFRTTSWTMVCTAGHQSHPGAQRALAEVCSQYWYPLYAFVRRKGHSPEEAQDLTQGFFFVLLQKNYLQSADRDRGRFRTFLLAAIENYLRNEWAKQQTLKRGGAVQFVSWQTDEAESRYQQEPIDIATPEIIFERAWAISVVEMVFERLRTEFSKAGKRPQFEILQVFLSGEKTRGSYVEVAAKLQFSEGAARVAVHRLRTRYGELLREALAETVSDPEEVDDEVRHLLAVLSE